jgi:hypothetical protein
MEPTVTAHVVRHEADQAPGVAPAHAPAQLVELARQLGALPHREALPHEDVAELPFRRRRAEHEASKRRFGDGDARRDVIFARAIRAEDGGERVCLKGCDDLLLLGEEVGAELVLQQRPEIVAVLGAQRSEVTALLLPREQRAEARCDLIEFSITHAPVASRILAAAAPVHGAVVDSPGPGAPLLGSPRSFPSPAMWRDR